MAYSAHAQQQQQQGYPVAGHRVRFPFPPYGPQFAFM